MQPGLQGVTNQLSALTASNVVDHRAVLQVVCGTMGLPTATVRLMGPDGKVQIGTGMGTGPVDAAYKAIDSIVKVQVSSGQSI